MKILGIILLVGMFFSSPTENAETIEKLNLDNPTTELTMGEATTTTGYVRFGRRKKNCRGFGICSARISTTNTDKGTKTIFGFNGRAIVYLRWAKKDVAKNSDQKHLKDGLLILEEEVDEAVEYKGEKYSLKIAPGKYELKEDGEGFLLEVSG